MKPEDIERRSMEIIESELTVALDEEIKPIVKRVIHATADFSFAESLHFTPGVVGRMRSMLSGGATVITDTNMALAGLSRPSLKKLGCEAFCFIADRQVAAAARENGTTRAVAAMEYAAEKYPGAVFAIGNAPTALFKLSELMRLGLRPALVIAVPVGFVNVIEGKEEILRTCREYGVPAIAARGRKGGSTVAAAILNALLLDAAGMLAPESRGF